MARSTRSVPLQQTHHQTTTTTHQPSTTTLHTIYQLSQLSKSLPVQHHNTNPNHPHTMPATPPPTSFRCLTTRTRSWGRVVKHRPHPTPLPGGWPKTAQPSHIHSLVPGHNLYPPCRAPRQHLRHPHDTLQLRKSPPPRAVTRKIDDRLAYPPPIHRPWHQTDPLCYALFLPEGMRCYLRATAA